MWFFTNLTGWADIIMQPQRTGPISEKKRFPTDLHNVFQLFFNTLLLFIHRVLMMMNDCRHLLRVFPLPI